jgi:hypothetical protein
MSRQTMANDDKEQATSRRYRLELVATGTDEEATRRLRGMLKLALRGFGLRCVEAVEIRDENLLSETKSEARP